MNLIPATIRDYDQRAASSDETTTATFALGCFWGPEATFGAMDGVVRTRVGYAGGTKRDPSYHALGDHSEVFQVDYDPGELAYADLLDHVFRSHDPRRQTRKTQYQNVVFYDSEEQRAELETYLDENGFDADAIETRIERLSGFSLAETYHQKHSLRSRGSVLNTFAEAGYDDDDVRESPAAAKLNGYAAGRDISPDVELGVTDRRRARNR